MYACKNSKPQGLEENFKTSFFLKADRIARGLEP